LNTQKILISQRKIKARLTQLGHKITRDYAKLEGELVVVCVLKGAVVFLADLIRSIDRPVRVDFLRVSSYVRMRSTGQVRLEFDLTQPIAGKHVLLIEDIVDTGKTLEFLLRHLKTGKPKSLRVCTLLYKKIRPTLRKKIDYVGFTIPNRFVVGYGMDCAGLHRNLPNIVALSTLK
jgi:hypoxanthine phosphoribosyltransferase